MPTTASYPIQLPPGSFGPTTNVWDINPIEVAFESGKISQEDLKELLVRLYQNINFMAINVNYKDTGYYPMSEFLTGAQYFQNPALSSLTANSPIWRSVYRKVINFGALPAAASTVSVAHNITINALSGPAFSFTRIYATASDTIAFSYIPIPYASAIAANIVELSVDATNVNITVNSNMSNYNLCYVVLEYIKS